MKRFLCVLVSLIFVLGMLPASAIADDNHEVSVSTWDELKSAIEGCISDCTIKIDSSFTEPAGGNQIKYSNKQIIDNFTSADANYKVVSKNKKAALTDSVEGSIEFSGKVTLDGRALTENDVFTFSVYEGENVVATGQNDATGKITFTEIKYTKKIDSGEESHDYIVKQDSTTIKGITIDTTEHKVNVIVKAADGKMTVTPAEEFSNLNYTNTYTPPTTYAVTVVNGTTQDSPAEEGDTVKIKANAPDAGKRFDQWTSEDGVTFASATSAETSITMPGKAVTVTANYKDKTKLIVTMTKDGETVTDVADYLSLKAEDGTEYKNLFVYDNGSYVYDPTRAGVQQISSGNYDLCFNAPGYPATSTSFEYIEDVLDIKIPFEFFTVSIVKDPAFAEVITSVQIARTGKDPEASGSLVAQKGEKLDIKTTIKDGYHFDGYTASGTEPVWDKDKAEQTIEVQGTAEIMAHAEANVYTVHFDPNMTGSTGTMEDQDMVYDEPQKLFTNQFSYVGGTFTGWNTKADGTGTAYTNEESVMNLTAEDGGKVTLYAQWTLYQYDVKFVNDDGTVLQSSKVAYGKTPEYTGKTPEKKETAEYTYTFKGWTPEITTVKGDATYTATYTAKAKQGTYEAVGGSGSSWTQGSTNPLVFTFKRTVDDETTFYHFAGIEIDGRPVQERDASGRVNYTAEKGSLIISLQPVFLETLAAGQHTLRAFFNDGNYVDATFTIAKAGGGSGTGDTQSPVLWIIIAAAALVIAAVIVIIMLVKGRKKK